MGGIEEEAGLDVDEEEDEDEDEEEELLSVETEGLLVEGLLLADAVIKWSWPVPDIARLVFI